MIAVYIILWLMEASLASALIAQSLNAVGLEFVNPIWLYNHLSVNWFGAIMISLFFNLICSVASLIYWFYKLCTVGAVI